MNRFIPVYTGNSGVAGAAIDPVTVYPCVYRELWEPRIKLDAVERFIPVYTGNSIVNSIFLGAPSVYPCVYRELHSALSDSYNRHGLSLCIQGTLISSLNIPLT